MDAIDVPETGPSAPDLDALAGDMMPADLKRSRLRKRIERGTDDEDVAFMIRTLCDHELLDAGAERELAELIVESRARYQHCLAVVPANEHEIAKTLDAYLGNRRELVRNNMRLVVAIAGRYRNLGLTLPELVSAGNEGLLIAVDRYDPAIGTRFSTYAVWWIRNRIQEELAHSRTIPLSAQIVSQIYRMRTLTDHYKEEHKGKPSDAWLAEQLGISVDQVGSIRKAGKGLVRLDALIGHDSDTARGDIVPDARTSQEERDLHHSEVAQLFHSVLATEDLSELEIETFLIVSGFKDGQRHKAGEAAGRLGISNGTASQYAKKVRRVLEKHPRMRRIAEEHGRDLRERS